MERFTLNGISPRTITCVDGYIREFQEEISKHYEIPPLINHLCILYCRLIERFTICGSTATIIGDKENIVKNVIGGSWANALGQIKINFNDDEHAMYEWKFKATHSTEKSAWILYGIWSDINDKKPMDGFLAKTGFAYALHVGVSMIYVPGNEHSQQYDGWRVKPSKEFSTNDVITMRLNTKTGVLSFLQNDEFVENSSRNIDKSREYQMVIGISEVGNKVELLDFKMHTISET